MADGPINMKKQARCGAAFKLFMKLHLLLTVGVLSKVASGEQLNLTFADQNLDRSALEGWITLDLAEQLFAEMGTSYAEMKSLALSKDFQPVVMEGMK